MIWLKYRSDVQKAFELMVKSHSGQFYGENCYFMHPIQVADTLFNSFYNVTPNDLIVVLLHDIVEDTDVKLSEIKRDFGAEASTAIDLLTKKKGLSYKDEIDRIIQSNNSCAIRVKWCDNYCNMNSHKEHMTVERRQKLSKRYTISFRKLSEASGR